MLDTYNLPLAIEDFVPVLLSSLGLLILSRMMWQADKNAGTFTTIGWILVTLGGFCKALWKLIMALSASQTDITFLDNSLFIFMAAGFTLFAWGIWVGQQNLAQRPVSTKLWPVPIGIIALFYTGAITTAVTQSDRTWFFILLGLTTLANVVMAVLLINQAWRERMPTAAGLFLTNLLAVFVLQGLARVPDQTIALQWVEQGLNTLAQGAFALGAWKLSAQVLEAVFERRQLSATAQL